MQLSWWRSSSDRRPNWSESRDSLPAQYFCSIQDQHGYVHSHLAVDSSRRHQQMMSLMKNPNTFPSGNEFGFYILYIGKDRVISSVVFQNRIIRQQAIWHCTSSHHSYEWWLTCFSWQRTPPVMPERRKVTVKAMVITPSLPTFGKRGVCIMAEPSVLQKKTEIFLERDIWRNISEPSSSADFTTTARHWQDPQSRGVTTVNYIRARVLRKKLPTNEISGEAKTPR